MPGPVFLSGKVVLEDGSAPPEPVGVECVCGGVVAAGGYTDPQGDFSLQLGQDQPGLADASVPRSGVGLPGGDNRTNLDGCEMAASLIGYQSDQVLLAGHRYLDTPGVGSIILRRTGDVNGTTVSITSLAVPKNAARAYNQGLEAMKKGQWAEARKQFERAVELYPRYAAAWFELGRTFEQAKDKAAARRAHQRASEADAKYLPPILRLAGLAFAERNWKAVVETTNRILKLAPVTYPGMCLYNAIANFSLRNLDAAEKSVREALKLDPQHRFPSSYHVLGVIEAERGDYRGAAENLRTYLQLAPDAGDAEFTKQQLALDDQLAGKQAAAVTR